MNDIHESTILNILSLEDSIFDFEIISEKLMGAGYQLNISRVEKEAEFTSLIRSNTYDIILADYNLPNFDAFKALKICNKYCPQIPFICVSGSIGEIMAIELLKQGAVDYVLKDRLERLPFAIKSALADAKEKNKRRGAEEALRESEERLRDILFSTADWVWEVDENGVYTYSSQKRKELLKASQDEIIGKTPFDFMPPEEAKRVGAIFSELVKNREPVIDLENWNIGKDGNMICLLTNGVPIFNSEGQFKGYRGVDKNITERKLAENAIKQSEADLNYAQEIGNMGSWHYHIHSHKYKISNNLAHMLSIESLDDKTAYNEFRNHIYPEDKYLIDLNSHVIATTQSEVSYELRYILDNGEIIWLQNNIRPSFQDGKLIDLHGVMIDITEKKRTQFDLIKAKENAEASDRLKTTFINNISHEIRTPLNGILGFTEVLTDPNLQSDEKDKYLAMLYNSSDRLINTVTNFLDIALLTSGTQKVFKKEIDLKSLMNQTIECFKNAGIEKKLTLSLDIPEEDESLTIVTDKDLLEKTLHQLIDNAFKFTSEGTITIGYKMNENELLFFVQDTGIGIHAQSRKQIFEYFTQENSANTRGYEGSGLGLTIAKGFVGLLGGKIWLDSEKEIGSTFYFSIPLEKQRIMHKKKIDMNSEIPVKHKQIILIAEDDEKNFFDIDILFKGDSIGILHAKNGIEAVELCQTHPEIELVIMDIKMPQMDGFEATRQIKAFRPDLSVIAISAFVGSEEQHLAFEAGCDEFITKPIKKELLMQTLEENGLLIT